MSILDDFITTDSIRLDPVGLDIVEPPRIVFAPDPIIPAGPTTRTVPCITKRPGMLDATITILGIAIPFRGMFLGVDSMRRWLIRWSVDDRTPRPFMITTIRLIQGQITVAIAPLEPARTDLTTCSDAAGEFFVSLSLVSPEDVDERFERPPNEIRIEADLITRVRSLITSVRGDAGVAAPPPTPWPQPAWVTLSTTCVNSTRVTRRVFVEVRLDRPILRSHAGVTCSVSAQGIDPPRHLTVIERPIVIGSSSVYREVLLPLDLTGRVRVTAVTNDRSRARSAEFGVVGSGGGLGCGGMFEEQYYDARRVGCEAYDCGWTGLNDLTELIGRSGGWAVRYLTTRRVIDPVGRLVGDGAVLRAINNHGTVVGLIDQGDGKVESFLYGEMGADAPELHRVPGVLFHALNDEGVAVGSRFDGKRTVPVRWTKGQIEEIKVPTANAIALAVDGAGNIAGLHVEEGSGSVRAFVMDKQEFRDLGALWGNVVTLAMNGAGAIAGTVISNQKVRGFAYSPKTGLFDLKLPIESGQSAVSGINDAGMIVGTFRSDKDGSQRAFRFTMERGSEDLNAFIKSDGMVVVEAAIAINNQGQILALGSEKGDRGYFLLNPTSIPTPQVPIP